MIPQFCKECLKRIDAEGYCERCLERRRAQAAIEPYRSPSQAIVPERKEVPTLLSIRGIVDAFTTQEESCAGKLLFVINKPFHRQEAEAFIRALFEEAFPIEKKDEKKGSSK
jgi:hypothetical protein